MILPQKNVFQNIKIKLNLRTWMTLKSSVVIFQALELLQPNWPHRPLQPHWPLQPQKQNFTKKLAAPNDWFIPGTKMFNTGPFLWNGSSKIQFFTDIWYFFWLRLLRPADVIFLKNGCGTQKFPISAFQNHLQTQFNLHTVKSRAVDRSTIQFFTFFGVLLTKTCY